MKLIFIISLLLSSFLIADVKLNIRLHEGDILVGTPLEQSISLKTEYGDLKIDMARIQEISFDDTTRITFVNQDQLQGILGLKKLRIKCELGEIEVPVNKIKAISRVSISESVSALQWSPEKDGLKTGIRINSSSVHFGQRLSVYVEVRNMTNKIISVVKPMFNSVVASSDENINNSSVSLLIPSINLSKHKYRLQDKFAFNEKVNLHAGAKIIFEFDVLLLKGEVEAKQLVPAQKTPELKDIKKKLHFKQPVECLLSQPGETHIKCKFLYENDKALFTPELKLNVLEK